MATCQHAGAQLFRAGEERLAERALSRIGDVSGLFDGWHHVGPVLIDSINVNRSESILAVHFSPSLTHIPLRTAWIDELESALAGRLGFRFRNYSIRLYSRDRVLDDYVPNYLRPPGVGIDHTRLFSRTGPRRLIREEGRDDYGGGLSGSHIALWPSHGYHYAAQRDRWEWQRARLYGTIEDLFPFSYIHPWLLAMLENAGATVFLPRERDIQHREVIVAPSGSTGRSEIIIPNGGVNTWSEVTGSGFATRDTLFDGDNPFMQGSHFRIQASQENEARLRYVPDIPEDGEYAVYVSWVSIPENTHGVRYTVNYSGGSRVFLVDQTMGAGTWIYLGKFHFFRGMDPVAGSLDVSGQNINQGFVTSGAVRFGGGMGNVARKPAEEFILPHWSLHDGLTLSDAATELTFRKEPGWKLSGRPRYMEGARYWLQYSGMPDSLVYSPTGGKNDYNDDFMSRGEWVNFLSGSPMGVTGVPAPGNPGIPLDLAIAFHTDAGVTPGDSIIGTLAIYSTQGAGGAFFDAPADFGGAAAASAGTPGSAAASSEAPGAAAVSPSSSGITSGAHGPPSNASAASSEAPGAAAVSPSSSGITSGAHGPPSNASAASSEAPGVGSRFSPGDLAAAASYPNPISRLASRDLADLIQTQITDDIRLQVNDRWTRRGLWDRRYSEAWRPQVPTVLLELLSHQNLADMSYGLDPRFRFIVSRAIYKGVLRYLAAVQGREAIVQPLPPNGMAMEKTGPGTIRLSWQGQADPLEPSATPEWYRVYTRTENAGFDNGTETTVPYLDIHVEKDIIYGFKVAAVNRGGESMPGEILSVLEGAGDEKTVLIVNGFTRISGPSIFDLGGMAGIKWWDDPGVPYKYDFSHTGVQYDFDRLSPWLDDDSPGWGASYANMEGKVIPGNNFDYPFLYGLSLREKGHSFLSVSREAFERNTPDPDNHKAVIVVFGEQRGVPSWKDPSDIHFRVLSSGMINALRVFAEKGVGIMVSGSYLGTDMIENGDTAAISFARDFLGFTWRTNHASNTGDVTATSQTPGLFPSSLRFNDSYDPEIYRVVAPDAIEAAGENAFTIYRYSSNGTSAGVLKNGRNRVVSLGFPLETIPCKAQRTEFLGRIIEFLIY
jgi:hypothetical protein